MTQPSPLHESIDKLHRDVVRLLDVPPAAPDEHSAGKSLTHRTGYTPLGYLGLDNLTLYMQRMSEVHPDNDDVPSLAAAWQAAQGMVMEVKLRRNGEDRQRTTTALFIGTVGLQRGVIDYPSLQIEYESTGSGPEWSDPRVALGRMMAGVDCDRDTFKAAADARPFDDLEYGFAYAGIITDMQTILTSADRHTAHIEPLL